MAPILLVTVYFRAPTLTDRVEGRCLPASMRTWLGGSCPVLRLGLNHIWHPLLDNREMVKTNHPEQGLLRPVGSKRG